MFALPTQAAPAVATIPFNRPFVTGAELGYVIQAIDSGVLSGDGPFTRRATALLTELTGALDGVGTTRSTASFGLLPAGYVGTRQECDLLTTFGATLPAVEIRPGVLLCSNTSARRHALLRILEVQLNTAGRIEFITIDVIVWEPTIHTN